MAQLLVRNVSDVVKERLKQRAINNGRSLEAEARAILSDAAGSPKPQRVAAKAAGGGWATDLARKLKKTGLTKKDADALDANVRELRKSWRMRSVDFGK